MAPGLQPETRMRSAIDLGPADRPFGFSVVGEGRTFVRQVIRMALVCALLTTFAYSASRAWVVLGALDAVKLRDAGRILDVVSLRDAILSIVAYGLGKELVRALGRRRDDTH
jgi:hypothetical protein